MLVGGWVWRWGCCCHMYIYPYWEHRSSKAPWRIVGLMKVSENWDRDLGTLFVLTVNMTGETVLHMSASCAALPLLCYWATPLLRLTSFSAFAQVHLCGNQWRKRVPLYHLLPLYRNDLWPIETSEAPHFIGLVTGRGRGENSHEGWPQQCLEFVTG